jgi:tetratricopeptide (TPR) repeat protein
MLAHELSSAKIEHATGEKTLRARTARLVLTALFGGFIIFALGYTTVHCDELPAAELAAQADSLQSTPQPTVPPQDLQIQALVREVELVKIKVESEMEASRTGIEAIKEISDRNSLIFTIIGGLTGLFSLVTLGTSLYRVRQEHQDYAQERNFYENRARHSEDRSQVEHKAILELYGAQIKARQGENKHAGRMFALQEENLREVNTITTAIAAGAKENVDSLNTILSTFQQIMKFKVDEAEDTSKAMKRMDSRVKELEERLAKSQRRQEEAQSQQVERLLFSAQGLRRARHIYTSPEPDLQRQTVEFRTQMDLMQRAILDQHTGIESPEENRPYGEIYLRRGIIAYYDNDMLKSRDMLRIAAKYFPFLEQGIESMSRDEKLPIAFTQFYLALIEKNYGTMDAARDHIKKSYAAYGRDEPEELMTPVTRAEILSYLEDMDTARAAIQEVLNRADNLRRRQSLKKHDANYALRARLLLGNTYYVRGEWRKALQHYQDTLKANAGQDSSYYAYHSIAQVYHQLKDEEKAKENIQQAYDRLIETDHLRTKVALDTQILLNALAYLCTREDKPEKAKEYRETFRELWGRIRKVNDLELRLFSFEKKQPIGRDEFLAEVLGG